MMNTRTIAAFLILPAAVLIGCKSRTADDVSHAPAAAAIAAKYLVEQEPPEPKDVNDVVENVADKESVTVLGRIGGSRKPFIDDLAAFTIVDRKRKPCNEIPDDPCPTPWDYCCDSRDLSKSLMTVKFVDDKRQVVPIDAKQLFNLEELQTVVVSGELQKTEDGSVALLAKKIYVRQP